VISLAINRSPKASVISQQHCEAGAVQVCSNEVRASTELCIANTSVQQFHGYQQDL